MAKHWPNTKFINLVRDVDGWQASLKVSNFFVIIFTYLNQQKFMTTLYDLPDDTLLDQILANNPLISPTAHHGLNAGLGYYCSYIIGVPAFIKNGATWDSENPWDRMLPRLYRMFMSDVQMNAPKDRTLFNYK